MIVRHVITTIWCDFEGCNNSFEDEKVIHQIIKDARHNGWTSGKRQLCPLHSHSVVSPVRGE